MRRKPQTALLLGILSPGGGQRATAISNMHKNVGRERAYGSGDIIADRQAHTQTCLSQYFATAPAGKVELTLSDKPTGPCFRQNCDPSHYFLSRPLFAVYCCLSVGVIFVNFPKNRTKITFVETCPAE